MLFLLHPSNIPSETTGKDNPILYRAVRASPCTIYTFFYFTGRELKTPEEFSAVSIFFVSRKKEILQVPTILVIPTGLAYH